MFLLLFFRQLLNTKRVKVKVSRERQVEARHKDKSPYLLPTYLPVPNPVLEIQNRNVRQWFHELILKCRAQTPLRGGGVVIRLNTFAQKYVRLNSIEG